MEKAQKINEAGIKDLYSKYTTRKVLFIVIGIIMLFVLSLIALTAGAAQIRISETISSIIGRILPFTGMGNNTFVDVVIWDLRLPRVVIGIIAGAIFAISGATMQGVMRNPLVSPYTIGVSSGASFGATLAIILGVGLFGAGTYVIIANAFVFSLAATFFVYGIARVRGISSETLLLAGIAVMYLFSAMTSFLQYGATEEKLLAVVHWLFGNLAVVTWDNILIVSIVFLICLPLLIKYSWDLNALASGDETATSLGVNVNRVRIICMVLASLITSTTICFTGIIGFVCLVAPHLTRMIIGGDHRFLLPCSCVIGSLLLLGADTIGRTIIQPTEIPVGIMTAFIGIPFFLYLLLTRRKQYWQ